MWGFLDKILLLLISLIGFSLLVSKFRDKKIANKLSKISFEDIEESRYFHDLISNCKELRDFTKSENFKLLQKKIFPKESLENIEVLKSDLEKLSNKENIKNYSIVEDVSFLFSNLAHNFARFVNYNSFRLETLGMLNKKDANLVIDNLFKENTIKLEVEEQNRALYVSFKEYILLLKEITLNSKKLLNSFK